MSEYPENIQGTLPAGAKVLDIAAREAEFHRQFPELKGRVFVLNPQGFADGKAAIASIRGALDQATQPCWSIVRWLMPRMAAKAFARKTPMAANFPVIDVKTKQMSIAASLVIPADPARSSQDWSRLFLGARLGWTGNAAAHLEQKAPDQTLMWQRFVLDHELGHCVTLNQQSDYSLAAEMAKVQAQAKYFLNWQENCAESFAMINHAKLYGTASPFPDTMHRLRVMATIHRGELGHYTSRGIRAVQAKLKQLDAAGQLQSLTPAQMRDLANETAQSVACTNADFAEFRKAFPKPGFVKRLLGLAKGDTSFDTPEAAIARVRAVGTATSSVFVRQLCQEYLEALPHTLPKGAFDEGLLNSARADIQASAAQGFMAMPEAPSAIARAFNQAGGAALGKAANKLRDIRDAIVMTPRL